MRWLGSGKRGVFNAVAAGALLPGCAMTTMPLAAGLKAKGVPRGTLTAFIMIAPILSPHTVILTFAMLGWKMTVGRIVLPVAVSWIIGVWLNASDNKPERQEAATTPLSVTSTEEKSTCGCDEGCASGETPTAYWKSVLGILKTLSLFFLGALLVAAILQATVPSDFFQRHMQTGWMAYLVAAVAGIPLYVCEGAEVPLTIALLKLGVGSGPAFTFLLASVGTCFPTVAMAPRIIGLPATIIYVVAWLLLTVGGGVLFSLL